MIEFQKVRYKNFLSVGEQPVEISFDSQRTLLLSGANGSGKSSILEALVFGLYNKSFRKSNKPQLINSINGKGTLVEVWFKANGKEYHVKRGMKPGVFEIYEDGSLIEQEAKNQDYQKHLEQNILKISFLTFCQCVVLSTSNFKPFMELNTGQRREVIEDLLDINIFTIMNRVLKDKIRETNDAVKDAEHQLEMNQLKIDSLRDQIELIQRQNQDTLNEIKAKAKEKKEKYRELKQQKDEVQKHYEERQAEYQELVDQLGSKQQQAEETDRKLATKLDKFRKEVSFFQDNDRCPTCYQTIDEDFVPRLLEKRTQQIGELETSREYLAEKLKGFKEWEEKANAKSNEMRELKQQHDSLKTQLKILREELEKLQTEYADKQARLSQSSQSELESLRELESTQQTLTEQRDQLREEQDYQKVAQRLLKDDGIKATIIRKYLPVINQKILEYLDKFDFHTVFRLDEEFNEEILARYHDKFSYENFSAGERQRIDLALLFAWRDVAQKKNSVATNLLFLDEILDSSCDQHALNCLMDILMDKAKHGTRVVVITHRNTEMFYDRFDAQIALEKDARGFSQISTVEKE